MAAKSKEELKAENDRLILQYAADTRKFEIQLFWQRSLFFWGFVVASLIALSAMDLKSEVQFRTPIICFGFLTSLAWTLQNRGSKYWQEAWEQKVEFIQNDAIGMDLFHHKEQLLPVLDDRNWKNAWLRARRYSVTKLAIAMSDLIMLLWFYLAIIDAKLNLCAGVEIQKAALYFGALLFATAICIFGRSTD